MDPRKQKTGAEKRKEQRKRALEQAGNNANQMKLTFKSLTEMSIRYEKTQVEMIQIVIIYRNQMMSVLMEGDRSKQKTKNIDAKDPSEVPGDTDVTMPEDAQNKEVKLKQTDLETTNEVRGTDILSKAVKLSEEIKEPGTSGESRTEINEETYGETQTKD